MSCVDPGAAPQKLAGQRTPQVVRGVEFSRPHDAEFLDRDHLVVLDLIDGLKLIDLQGSTSTALASKGEGPKELSFPTSLGRVGESVAVYDTRLTKLLVVSLSDVRPMPVSRDLRPGAAFVGAVEQHGFFVAPAYGDSLIAQAAPTVGAARAKIIAHLKRPRVAAGAQADGTTINAFAPHPLGPQDLVAVQPDRGLLVFDGGSGAFTVFDTAGVESDPIPSGIVRRTTTPRMIAWGESQLTGIFESAREKAEWPDFAPMGHKLFADAEGLVLLAEGAFGEDEQVVRVYDRTLRNPRYLKLPGDLEVLAIGYGRIALVEESPLGLWELSILELPPA